MVRKQRAERNGAKSLRREEGLCPRKGGLGAGGLRTEWGEGGTPGPKEGLGQGRAQARGSRARVTHRKQLEVGFGGFPKDNFIEIHTIHLSDKSPI